MSDTTEKKDPDDPLDRWLLELRATKFDNLNPRHLIYYSNPEKETRHDISKDCWCEPMLVDNQPNRPPIYRHRRLQ